VKRLVAVATMIAIGVTAPGAGAADVPIVGGTSFNDAAPIGPGHFSDALDSGSTVFYRLSLVRGEQLNAGASLDVSGLDASLTGTSSLVLRLYGPLRGQDTEAQTLGPGDSATHLKATNASIGPVTQAGDYYVSAGVNDFLPQGNTSVQLPLALTIGIADKAAAAAPRARVSSGGSGASWAVLAALCLGGALLGGAGGLIFRRR
jgi:Ca-activated chloride channel homolog